MVSPLQNCNLFENVGIFAPKNENMAKNDFLLLLGQNFHKRKKNSHKHEKRFTRYMYLDGFGKLLVILLWTKK